MQKARAIGLNILPVVLMVGLIPLVPNDYLLTALDGVIILAALVIHYEPHDVTALLCGVVLMTISESFFLWTRVETFNRATLFGIMPLWLPVLWGYGFVAIKRVTYIVTT